MPKRGLDVMGCEVFRFYRLIAVKDLVGPLSMIVPRKKVETVLSSTSNEEGRTSMFTVRPPFPVRGFPGGSLPTDGWKPGGRDGAGVAPGDQQGSVTTIHPTC